MDAWSNDSPLTCGAFVTFSPASQATSSIDPFMKFIKFYGETNGAPTDRLKSVTLMLIVRPPSRLEKAGLRVYRNDIKAKTAGE